MLHVNLITSTKNSPAKIAANRRWYERNRDAVTERRRAADPTRRRDQVRLRKMKNPEMFRAYEMTQRLHNPVGMMLSRSRRRAKVIGVPFDLDASDIQIPTVCPVLGIPIVLGAKGYHDGAASLDRVDSARGYVKGNVAVISRLANIIKSSGTASQHERIAAWMRDRGAE